MIQVSPEMFQAKKGGYGHGLFSTMWIQGNNAAEECRYAEHHRVELTWCFLRCLEHRGQADTYHDQPKNNAKSCHRIKSRNLSVAEQTFRLNAFRSGLILEFENRKSAALLNMVADLLGCQIRRDRSRRWSYLGSFPATSLDRASSLEFLFDG